ncbi:MAG: DUF1189 family protein [Verrucomicrobiae bacterium]|nr:DUF1189 family protein [Verrucomicrobiae bacterium]
MPFFATLIHSCSSFDFYATLLNRTLLQVLLTLLKFLLLLCLAMTLILVPLYRQAAGQLTSWILENLPRMTLSKGTLTTQPPLESPLTITGVFAHLPNMSNATYEVRIDPAGKQSFDTAGGSNRVLNVHLSGSALTLESRLGPYPQRESLAFRNFPEGAVNRDYLTGLFNSLIYFSLVPVTYVVLMILFVLLWIFQNTVFVTLSHLLERLVASPLSFQEVLKISLIACMPASLVATVYIGIGFFMIEPNLVYLFTYSIFFLMGMNAARSKRILDDLRRNKHDEF